MDEWTDAERAFVDHALATGRVLGPSQAPEQREADVREKDLRDPDLTARLLLGWKEHEAALVALHDTIAVQACYIDEQAAALDDLHVANRHLAQRLDKMEHDIARLLAAVPSTGKPTIQEQCQAVTWRPPTKEDEG